MINLAIPGADLILMGVSEDKVQINTRVILDKGLSLKGVTRSTRKDFEHAKEIIEDKAKKEKLEPMVLSEKKIASVVDIYHCYEEEINNKTKIGKNLLKW